MFEIGIKRSSPLLSKSPLGIKSLNVIIWLPTVIVITFLALTTDNFTLKASFSSKLLNNLYSVISSLLKLVSGLSHACKEIESLSGLCKLLTDYRRYLKGNESYLHTYLTGNENSGKFAYDLSSTGFSFHGNNAKLDNTTSFSNIIPTNTQLGILGVTDAFGNFVISSVPYSGNGTSYTLVPSLGKHEFNPKQQLAYIGVGSTVINNVNFKDISSFTFNGIAVYDSRGVFPTT